MNDVNINFEDVLNPLGMEIGQLKILLSMEQAKVKSLQAEVLQLKEELTAPKAA